jgi:hypothetical protein
MTEQSFEDAIREQQLREIRVTIGKCGTGTPPRK